jgi:hypothetical protein
MNYNGTIKTRNGYKDYVSLSGDNLSGFSHYELITGTLKSYGSGYTKWKG